jgi:hypothetical protein
MEVIEQLRVDSNKALMQKLDDIAGQGDEHVAGDIESRICIEHLIPS